MILLESIAVVQSVLDHALEAHARQRLGGPVGCGSTTAFVSMIDAAAQLM